MRVAVSAQAGIVSCVERKGSELGIHSARTEYIQVGRSAPSARQSVGCTMHYIVATSLPCKLMLHMVPAHAARCGQKPGLQVNGHLLLRSQVYCQCHKLASFLVYSWRAADHMVMDGCSIPLCSQ